MDSKQNMNKIALLIAVAALLLVCLVCGVFAILVFLRGSDNSSPEPAATVELIPDSGNSNPRPNIQDGEVVNGWWSRLINDPEGLYREVVEFRSDGTYITGICTLQTRYSWCIGAAVLQIRGNYSLNGGTLTLTNGLMLLETLNSFGRQPDAPPLNLSNGLEVYQWRLDAGDLCFTDANNQNRCFSGMSKIPDGWINR